jgi:hypothetical protein
VGCATDGEPCRQTDERLRHPDAGSRAIRLAREGASLGITVAMSWRIAAGDLGRVHCAIANHGARDPSLADHPALALPLTHPETAWLIAPEQVPQ